MSGGQRASIHLIQSSLSWLPASAIQGEPGSEGEALLTMQEAPVFAYAYHPLRANAQPPERGRREDSGPDVQGGQALSGSTFLLLLHLGVNHLLTIRSSLN